MNGPQSLKLIIGLGNPGKRYESTRHNVGFMCVDQMAKRWGIKLSDRRKHVSLGRGCVDGVDVVLAKPRTSMNNSGEGIKYLLDRFHALLSDIVVIYDEMALPLGVIRLKSKGSAAGHRGMDSIIETVGSEDFPRLRLGIGKPEDSKDWVDYVLDSFSLQERSVLLEVLDRASEGIGCLLIEGIDVAMNRYN